MKLKPIKTTDNLAFYTLDTKNLDGINIFEGSATTLNINYSM